MRRTILAVAVRKFGASRSEEQDLLAVEEPLQIRLGGREIAVTMRTPGHDDELAAGFLFTEGILRDAADIARIECSRNTAEVTLGAGVSVDLENSQRNFYMTSSCGVCGKASIEGLESAGCTILPRGMPKVSEAAILSLPGKLRKAQEVFNRTGGLHASGLFSAEGELLSVREDVGRHNAVDKLVGRALLDRQVPLHGYILLVSGRTSFELVQKSVMGGIPVLAAVGAPSSLAVKTALRFGLTLIGFLRDDGFNVYSRPERICAPPR